MRYFPLQEVIIYGFRGQDMTLRISTAASYGLAAVAYVAKNGKRPPKDISMLEIIEAVDGPFIQVLEMAEVTHQAPFALKMEQVCHDAINKARDKFQKTKLSRLIS